MRGERRDRSSKVRALARWAALACVALAVLAQVAGADVTTPVDVDEPIAVADAVAVYPAAAVGSDESAHVADAVGVFPPVVVDDATPVGVADAVGVFPAVAVEDSTSVGVADAVGVFPAATVASDEPVHVSDDVSVIPPAIVVAAEPLHVQDDVAVSLAPYVADVEHVGVNDETSVEALLSPTTTTVAAGAEPLLLGGDEVLRASVSANGTPASSGFVTLLDGGVIIAGPLPLLPDGSVTFMVHGLSLGTHTLTAVFGGTPLLTTSEGTIDVHVYDYALSLAPATATVQRGGTVDYALTATLAPGSATGGSTAALALDVVGLPSGVSSSFAGALTLPSLGTTTLNVAATATAALGDASFAVLGDGGARTAGAHLYVNAPPVPSAGTYSGTEGTPVPLHATASDADGDALAYSWDLDGDGTFETAGASASLVVADGPATIHPVVRVCDDHDACATDTATVVVANVAPTVAITSPADGAIVVAGTPVTFTGTFTDPGSLDTHTIAWSFGATTLTASYTFTSPGFPTVTLTVTDDDGGVGSASVSLTVVDPSAGFVTGSGWIAPPSGRASFSFSARYVGATPTGAAEFQTSSVKFRSTSYRFLVVAGSSIGLEGQGTVNGAAGYSFRLDATDASPDTLRMRIWSTATGSTRYDSGGPRPLGGGQIQIHR